MIGGIHTRRAPGPLLAHVVLGERTKIFPRCLWWEPGNSLTVNWFSRPPRARCVYCQGEGRCQWMCLFFCLCGCVRSRIRTGTRRDETTGFRKRDMNKQTDEWMNTKTALDENRRSGEKVVVEAPLDGDLLFFTVFQGCWRRLALCDAYSNLTAWGCLFCFWGRISILLVPLICSIFLSA